MICLAELSRLSLPSDIDKIFIQSIDFLQLAITQFNKISESPQPMSDTPMTPENLKTQSITSRIDQTSQKNSISSWLSQI